MKKYLLFSLAVIASIQAAFAQPVLTAANSNPVAGDHFTNHTCIATGILQGAAGAAVTWDYHTLTDTGTVLGDFVTCASTPYCDSFAGSNLATGTGMGASADYSYYITNTNVWEVTGNLSGGAYTYYSKPDVIHQYPVVYNTSFLDTNISFSSSSSPVIGYGIIRDSNKIDGYGTLILPSGTYTNVLRQFRISADYGSIPDSALTYYGTYEVYYWYAPDFHFPLLEIVFDSSSGTGWSAHFVAYATKATTDVTAINTNEMSVVVSPNPASNVIHLKFSLDNSRSAIITLTDITGRNAATITGDKLNNGMNDITIPVSGLPEGMYILHLISAGKSVSQKIIVSR